MFSAPEKKPHTHSAGTPTSLLPQPLGITNLHSVSTDLPAPEMSLKRHHTACDLSCLASSRSIVSSRFMYVAACVGTSFLLMGEHLKEKSTTCYGSPQLSVDLWVGFHYLL